MSETVRTPSILQMEAVECGAASLAMILARYGRWVPLEELRVVCGDSPEGSYAKNRLMSARSFGLTAKGFRMELDELKAVKLPAIVFWNFNHFLVVDELLPDGSVRLCDPAMGPRTVDKEEFDDSFTGVVLTFEPGEEFKPGGTKPSIVPALKRRADGSEEALLFVVVAGLALVVPGLVIPTFARVFIDDFIVKGMTDWLRPLLFGMAATALLRGGLTWLQQYFLLKLETKLSVAGAGRFLWHTLRLPVEFYAQRYSGEISGRVALNKRVAKLTAGELAAAAIDALMVVFYALLMLTMSVPLTFIGVAAVFATAKAAKAIRQKRVDGSRRLSREQGKLMGVAMGGLQAIETLKATGSESDFFATWAGHQAKLLSYDQELQEVGQAFGQVPRLLGALTNAAVLGFGGWLVMRGSMTLGLLVGFQSLMSSFIDPVNRCVNLMGSLQEVEGDVQRLEDVLAYPIDPKLRGEDPSAPPEAAFERLTGRVELKGVAFGYSRLDAPLIEDFHLSVTPGQRVALVGGSGSGKSTVSKLVTGLYKPWSGEVLFDGVARQDLERAKISNSVALVDQEISLFEGTIFDNLTLWDSTVPEDRVIQACKDACIHDDIAARPDGYRSKLQEGGGNLSGGQRQRLELARALVTEPRVLVLDEATSALDTVTEQIIDGNLRARGCTCLIIAHRLSTIRDADEIIVMERGKVVQRGRHEELKAQEGGLYARLTAE